MEIGQKFNKLNLREYYYYIDNYKKYTDFNSLGLYRSIIENEKLTIDEKLLVREYAHQVFKKSFNFLQLNDPVTFMGVQYLGQELTNGDNVKIWDELRKAQQKILADKKIRHRNFGTYSKHECPYDNCLWNGVMIRQGSRLEWTNMHFDGDRNSYAGKEKSEKRKSDRKSKRQIISREIDM